MEYRSFGKTDLKVSAIGFGCWEVGGTYGRIDRGEFDRAVHQAIDRGITCFDTAEAYGPNEELVGEALAPFRSKVVIATKFGFDLNPEFDPRGMKGAPGLNLRHSYCDNEGWERRFLVSTGD